MAKFHGAVRCRWGATRRVVVVSALALAGAGAVGCRSSVVRNEPTDPAAMRARHVIPAQTIVETRLDQSVGTDINRPGDSFTATVMADVVTPQGSLVIPAGAVVRGVVTQVESSRGIGEQAVIGLAFEEVMIDGQPYPFSADVIETQVVHRHEAGDAVTGAAAGALGGAFLGAILGGGSGALKGGLAGAAGGTLIGLGTGDVQAAIPAGSRLVLRMNESLEFAPGPAEYYEEGPEELEELEELEESPEAWPPDEPPPEW